MLLPAVSRTYKNKKSDFGMDSNMFKNFWLAACRNLWRRKVHTLINVASLALGLGVFALSFLYVKRELMYDRSWPEAERIHRLVIEQQGLPGLQDGAFTNVFATTFAGFPDAFAAQIDASTRIVTTGTLIKDMELRSLPQERSESRLLLLCAALALLLSCIGLYGLAAFTMERQIKEVGVRKVLGASVLSLTGLYLWRYARPVLYANLLALPLALYFVLQWLQRFPYQLDKVWLLPLCLSASALVLLVALLAVSGVVLKAARARPVLALRYE